MAKKNFKGGLDSLLSNSQIDSDIPKPPVVEENVENNLENSDIDSNTVSITDEERAWYIYKIELLNTELKMWRTGQLTQPKFYKSLEEKKMTYNPEDNLFYNL